MNKINLAFSLLVGLNSLQACSHQKMHRPENLEVNIDIERLCSEQRIKYSECLSIITEHVNLRTLPKTQTKQKRSMFEESYQYGYTRPKQVPQLDPRSGSISFRGETKTKIHTAKTIPREHHTHFEISPTRVSQTRLQLEMNSFLLANQLHEKLTCKVLEDSRTIVCRNKSQDFNSLDSEKITQKFEEMNFNVQIQEDFIIASKS